MSSAQHDDSLLAGTLLASSPQRKRGQREPADSDIIGNRRKASKISRACDRCRSRKAKCSGTRPCDACVRKGVPCVYDGAYNRGRPPTPPPGTDLSDSVELGIAESPYTANDQVVTSHGLRNETGDINQPAGNVASRGSPEMEVTEVGGQYSDPTSGLTFLHRVWKRLSSHKRHEVPGVLDGAEKRQPLMRAGDKPLDIDSNDHPVLPDRLAGMEMLDFYFEVCVATYRFLHRQSIVDWFTVMEANIQQGLPSYHGLGEAKTAIILTIFAIVTLRQEKIRDVSGNQAWSLKQSDNFFSAATRLTEAETGLPRLESAQARLIQVLYLLQSSRMNHAWYIFGNTLQIISALGLHRYSVRKPNPTSTRGGHIDYVNAQCRKRTFWVAYTTDIYLGCVFGRPRHFHDEDIDQSFPDHVNDEDMTPHGPSATDPLQECHVESLIFHAKLARIIGDISREVYTIRHISEKERVTSAHRLGRELHKWRASLPAHLGSIRPHTLMPSFRRQATALKLAYAHAIMHANRPFLLRTVTGQNRTPAVRDSVNECITSARVALETVDNMATDGTLFHAFWWSHYVTFCALSVIYVWAIQQNSVTNGNDLIGDEDQELAKLFNLAERCHFHLARATSADSPSRRYSVILEELRAEAKLQSTRSKGNLLGQSQQGTALDNSNDNNNQDPNRPVPSELGQALPEHGEINDFHLENLLGEWQISDWLDLDSSVFGPFSGLGDSPTFVFPDDNIPRADINSR